MRAPIEKVHVQMWRSVSALALAPESRNEPGVLEVTESDRDDPDNEDNPNEFDTLVERVKDRDLRVVERVAVREVRGADEGIADIEADDAHDQKTH